MTFPRQSTRSASLPTSMEPTRSATPDVLGRADGDGAQRGVGVHAAADRKARAKRQVLLRDHRRIRDDGDVAARPRERARRLKGLVAQLELAGVGKARADRHGVALRREQLRRKVPLRAVLQGELYVELLGDADGGEQVVELVRVRLQGHFAREHGQQRLELDVKGRVAPPPPCGGGSPWRAAASRAACPRWSCGWRCPFRGSSAWGSRQRRTSWPRPP